MNKMLIPAIIFAVIVVFLGIGLTLNPREVPSPLIGKPAPAFSVTTLEAPAKMVSKSDMAGGAWVLNVFASWCGPCREEHPLLVDLARKSPVPIFGLNYKDQQVDAERWLNKFGNPYRSVLVDRDGRVGIDYGVYGVPETFVIDKSGTIRFKQIGPLTPAVIESKILPLLKELNG